MGLTRMRGRLLLLITMIASLTTCARYWIFEGFCVNFSLFYLIKFVPFFVFCFSICCKGYTLIILHIFHNFVGEEMFFIVTNYIKYNF